MRKAASPRGVVLLRILPTIHRKDTSIHGKRQHQGIRAVFYVTRNLEYKESISACQRNYFALRDPKDAIVCILTRKGQFQIFDAAGIPSSQRLRIQIGIIQLTDQVIVADTVRVCDVPCFIAWLCRVVLFVKRQTECGIICHLCTDGEIAGGIQ